MDIVPKVNFFYLETHLAQACLVTWASVWSDLEVVTRLIISFEYRFMISVWSIIQDTILLRELEKWGLVGEGKGFRCLLRQNHLSHYSLCPWLLLGKEKK